jgi:hypothetical protein
MVEFVPSVLIPHVPRRFLYHPERRPAAKTFVAGRASYGFSGPLRNRKFPQERRPAANTFGAGRACVGE